MYIDTHAHLTNSNFDIPLDQIISDMKTKGIGLVISQSTSLEDTKKNLEVVSKYPELVKTTVGIHPEDVPSDITNLTEDLSKFARENKEKFVAVGEVGLDDHMFNMDKTLDKELLQSNQEQVLRDMISLASELNLPMVIHSRDENGSTRVIEKILELLKDKEVKVVFHCFTYTDFSIAERILNLGHFISFTNIITYPKNTLLLELAKTCSKKYINQVMFETDSPYLPPKDRRGKICYPSDVLAVYDEMKDTISESQIESNAKTFFKL
jgi:TatD DNase family protein